MQATALPQRPSIDERIRQAIQKGETQPTRPRPALAPLQPEPVRGAGRAPLLVGVLSAVIGLSLAALAIRQVLEQGPKDEPPAPAPVPSHTFDPPAGSSPPDRPLPPAAPEPTPDSSADQTAPEPAVPSPPQRSSGPRVFPTVGGTLPRTLSTTPVRGDSLGNPTAEMAPIAEVAQTETAPSPSGAEVVTQEPTAKVSCIRRRIPTVAAAGMALNRDN